MTIRMGSKYRARVGWGTDIPFAPGAMERPRRLLAAMRRWYTPAQVLRMATSGQRSPYPGKLGVVEKDALADLLLVDGDPTEDLDILADPGKNLRMIMKAGHIHKNSLSTGL
jgi:imidazolonepropionase-like amidohydrolase